MSLTDAEVNALADDFIQAELHCAPLEPVSGTHPGLSAEDAYRVQDAIVALKLAQGQQVIGMKVGATSRPIQQLLGIENPVYGHLFKSSQVPSGASISFASLIHPRAECEIAFWLAKDLAGPGITEMDVLSATGGVAASLEINDPRTREWKIGQCEAIADNGLVARFVLADQAVPVAGLDLPAMAVVLRKNGAPVASATGQAVLGHPARAVAWLANKLAERGRSLAAGMLVLPGSLTPLLPVAPGDFIEAEFEQLGIVSVHFAVPG